MKKLYIIILFALVCGIANAQYSMLTDFTGNGAFTGNSPQIDQNLISVGGVLYGMTYAGGTNNMGVIFKVMPDGTGYSKLLDFAGAANGSYPYGSLISDGTFLYGMTAYGGTNDMGVIFKVKPDGTGYVKLMDFAGAANGSYPRGSLISVGGFLYGMTQQGGTNNLGTLFKIMPDGTGYSKLLDFAGASNGSYPFGSLISDGTFLYGMITNGGTNGYGTIFKIMPDGTGYSKLLDFVGAANGSYAPGSLISDGTFLYGMTQEGGTNNMGTIFKIMPDGTGYSKLLDFAGAANGRTPLGSLISDGGFLYGKTVQGGTNNMGTLFKIMPDGTGYSKLLDFAGAANGSFPYGSLISAGGFLYGMTSLGGISGMGTLFKIMPDGTGYVKLFDFAAALNGQNPYGSLISDGTFFYGMTYSGGSINGYGTIFKIMPDGTGYSKLLDFADAANGRNPEGSLISDGTFLYGMTKAGGTNNMGTLFKIMPDGTGYSKLLDFAGAANGSYPQGSLISDGTFLYGMTNRGGASNTGVIFKIMSNGTGYSKLLDFAGAANGSYPIGSLISDGTFLYGMTQSGGTNNMGALFKIMPDGTGYSKLLDFAGAANGNYPSGDLISDGIFLYGMTQSGGTNNMGALFKIMPDGTGYSKLLDFAGAANGRNPLGSLISDGGFLYGMTQQGGTNGAGTIFKIIPDGTGYVKLMDFAGAANGSYPIGSLISDGTFLYGMTNSGGTQSLGTVFKYNLQCTDVTVSQSPTVCAGQSITVGTNTYTVSGTYNNVLTSYQGCDSTVTTNLTVLPANTFSQSPTLCAGQSITVGTNTYTASGTYVNTLTAINGCDSTVTTNLTVLPANTFSQSPTLCAGQSITVGSNTYTVSNTYIDVLTSLVNGCDSTVTTNLTVLPANTFSQSPTLCAGQSITVGTNTYTASGTYVNTLTAINGCDSTVTTNLTVLPANTFSQSPTLCAGQSITVGTNTYTASGTYVNTLTAINGCDSTVTTNLTVLPANTFSQSPTLCAGQSITVGTNTYTASGTYVNTLTSINGCDSTVTTNLTVLPANTFSQSPTLCAGQSITVGTNTYTASGTYVNTLTAINGCDSTITTNLTVLPANTFSQSPTLCAGQSITVGTNTYTANGTYTDTLTAISTCDSIVTTNLTVNPMPGLTTTLNGIVITAIQNGGTYQWIDCSDSSAISGATNQSYTASANGNYAVIITLNNCSDTSLCTNVSTVGIAETLNSNQLAIYPNPFFSHAVLQTDHPLHNATLTVYNCFGQSVKEIKNINGQTVVLSRDNLASGLYFVRLTQDSKIIAADKLVITDN